ncbi:MAG: alpha/beta hydrolase [Pseudomonadales bacterium]
MTVNAQARAVLDLMGEQPLNPHAMSIAELRELTDMPATGLPAVGEVDNRTLELNGVDVPVRIYHPATPGPHRLLMYFHGGGWVICSLDTHDGTCRSLCNETDSVVVSVGYRLSPEAKFPAPLEDCYHATEWAVENAAELNADASKLIVAGDSAGGNLSAAVTLMARDRMQKGEPAPHIAYHVAIYPVTNHNFNTVSYSQNAKGLYLESDSMRWFWEQYLSNDADGQHVYASPLLADLTGLPPTLVITAEYDPLRDEGEAFAEKLKSAGVETNLIRYDGQIHGFIGMADMIDDGAAALKAIGKYVANNVK